MTAGRFAWIAATILGALLLTAARAPLDAPLWLRWLAPDWMLAVLLFWILGASARPGLVWAWLLGILVDVLTSDPLGLNALTLAVAVFLTTRFGQRLASWPVVQQAAFVAALALASELAKALLRTALGDFDLSLDLFVVFLPAVTTTAVFLLLLASTWRRSADFA